MDGATTAPELTESEEIASPERPLARPPLVLNRRSYGWITERISGAVENRAPRWWWVAFARHFGNCRFRSFLPGLSDFHRRWDLGTEPSRRMGLGHY